MAFSIFQAGSTLYGMDQKGFIAALTLPTGVVLDANKRARFAVIGNFAVMVNSPNRPITVDANLIVRVLTPDPPAMKLTLDGSVAGALSGTFNVRQTFIVRDQFGRIIGESNFGPDATAIVIASKMIQAQNLNLSGDQVSASRLYRTTNNTAVYFQWMDVDGNTQVSSIPDDVSDAGLATLSAPSLGTPPPLVLVAEFKSRLFGVGSAAPDSLFYSEVDAPYAWPAGNRFRSPRSGSDNRGITGLVRRRDVLGFGRANMLAQLTGTSDTDFRVVTITENAGIEAADSVAVYKDTAFFLWKDGVYQWDSTGLKNVAEGSVSRWFTRPGTFNLSRLQYAFAHIDPTRKKYRLFLASDGSNYENCWIEYDFANRKWWGPHMTHAGVPSAAFVLSTDSGRTIPIIGFHDGKNRIDRVARTDDDATGIDFDVTTGGDDLSEPGMEKYFGELEVSVTPQKRGTLDVYATVGQYDELRKAKDDITNEQPPFEMDLTQERQRLGRVGTGRSMRLRFRNNTAGEDVAIRGYEVNPVNIIGRR